MDPVESCLRFLPRGVCPRRQLERPLVGHSVLEEKPLGHLHFVAGLCQAWDSNVVTQVCFPTPWVDEKWETGTWAPLLLRTERKQSTRRYLIIKHKERQELSLEP